MRRGAFVCLALSLAGCSHSTALNQNYDLSRVRRIGVLKFESHWASSLGVEDIFAKHLIRRGYSVVERSHLEALLKEQKLGLTGLFGAHPDKDLGKILGVDALVIGQVTSFSPGRKRVVMATTRETYIEPIFKTERRKKKKVKGEDGKKGEDAYYKVQVQIGTKTRYVDKEIPTVFSIDAQVGIVAKLVDIETGEIIWIGSTTGEGVNALYAVESAVAYLVRKLRKDWRPPS